MMITPRQNCSCEEVATQEAARTLGTRQPLCVDPAPVFKSRIAGQAKERLAGLFLRLCNDVMLSTFEHDFLEGNLHSAGVEPSGQQS